MQLRWTEEAATDLEYLADYLLKHVPDRAAELVRTVYDAPAALLTFPHRGRPGKKAPTTYGHFRGKSLVNWSSNWSSQAFIIGG